MNSSAEMKDNEFSAIPVNACDEAETIINEFSIGVIPNSGGSFISVSTPATLTWSDLVVSTKIAKSKLQKQLLNNINGTINGGLWAIMGPSGSGKTTFLSALSLRLDTYRMTVAGNIFMNGKPYTKHQLKSMSGYVMQGRNSERASNFNANSHVIRLYHRRLSSCSFYGGGNA